jgi:hypothetical protein
MAAIEHLTGIAPFDRAAIERTIDALITMLDALDGDPDLEPEDCARECPDDVGELAGATWQLAPLRFSRAIGGHA